MNTRSSSLIWSTSVPTPPTHLRSSTPGVFQALDKTTHGAYFLAYRLAGGRVRSAIRGRRDGKLFGDEGVRAGRRVIRVLNQDSSHVGAVAYRKVSLYRWSHGAYSRQAAIERPDYALHSYPTPSALFHVPSGSEYLLRVDLATTEAQRTTGLMYVHSLDPDRGMLFTWSQPTTDAFWMENTYIPLTVAFLDANNVIIGMDDMAPLTTTYHYAPAPYVAAIEVNQGYFAGHGIAVGDKVQFLGIPQQPGSGAN